MGQLKKMVRKHEKPLQQVVRRYHEQSIKVLNNNKNINDEPQFEMPHKEDPLINEQESHTQFKILILEKFKIKIHNDIDSYVGVNIMEY